MARTSGQTLSPDTSRLLVERVVERAGQLDEDYALRAQLGDAIEFVEPQGGLFIWARLTGHGGRVADGAALAKAAIEQGVAFVPGAPFYARDPDPATLRLSFATAPLDQIREGVDRLARACRGA
mgnify:CR=1 FL=1